MSLALLQGACLLSPGLRHSRSDLVFQQSRLQNNLYFRNDLFPSVCTIEQRLSHEEVTCTILLLAVVIHHYSLGWCLFNCTVVR